MKPTTIEPVIVAAREDHASFVAWVMLAAARSHLQRGMWDLFVDGSEADSLRFLTVLAMTDTRHLFHWSTFLVAEVDGVPVAGLSGYFDDECGPLAVVQGIQEADRALGRTSDETAEGWRRAGAILRCQQDHAAGAWIVENVATLPEFRGRGLIDALLNAILAEGRRRGANVAEVGVLIGNEPAQAAYEKVGFAVVGEKRRADFEAAYHCPGMRHLSRSL